MLSFNLFTLNTLKKHKLCSPGLIRAVEEVCLQTPMEAFKYAKHVVGGRWPEAEPMLAKSYEAYNYATQVIKGPWPEGEDTIGLGSRTARDYAHHTLEGRFPKGEAAIAQDANNALFYARYTLGERFPQGEAVILRRPDTAYEYAREVIKGRWPEAEPILATDPQWAMGYALYVLQNRFPTAEPNLARHALGTDCSDQGKHCYGARYAKQLLGMGEPLDIEVWALQTCPPSRWPLRYEPFGPNIELMDRLMLEADE